jgi:hypothetical protein
MPHGWVRLTPEIARRQVRWLLRNVDKAVYGNDFKRLGSRTSRLVVIEGIDGFKRLHAHLAVGVPNGFSPVKFLELFENFWARANWGYGHGDADLCENPQRWISYILKTGAQGVDTENTQFH